MNKKSVSQKTRINTKPTAKIKIGFASATPYKVAVAKIYSRESKDIDSFLEFAESIARK